MWEWRLTSGMSLVCTQSIGFPTYCLAEKDWLDTLATSLPLYIYAQWCTNIQLLFHEITKDNSQHEAFQHLNALMHCHIVVKVFWRPPGGDKEGEWEAGKHSEGVVQPARKTVINPFSHYFQVTWILTSQFARGTASPGPSSLCEQNALK